ncbi:MAG: DNA polymerase IV, partial [Pseudomonadota bacterium]
TCRADTLLSVARRLIAREADGRAFRLIGIGVADLAATTQAADPPDLFSAADTAAPHVPDSDTPSTLDRGRD